MSQSSDHPAMSALKQQCMTDCRDCHTSCMDTATYCRTQGGRYADGGLIQQLLDCAGIAQQCADTLQKDEPIDVQRFAACAEACERVSQTVLAQFGDDATMKGCSTACLCCAESCQRVAQPGLVDYDEVVQESFPASDPPSTSALA